MKIAPIAIMATLLVACSTPEAPPPAPPAPAATPAAPPPPPPAPVQAAPPAPPPESALQRFERERSAIEDKSIYFAFDKSAINSDETSVIEAHAKLAQSFDNDRLTVQGNCDERGSHEYNLALGQRRADAVKQRLLLLGVPDARIQTVSFGKEKPRAACHAENCWSQNRRADFVDDWK